MPRPGVARRQRVPTHFCLRALPLVLSQFPIEFKQQVSRCHPVAGIHREVGYQAAGGDGKPRRPLRGDSARQLQHLADGSLHRRRHGDRYAPGLLRSRTDGVQRVGGCKHEEIESVDSR